MTTSDPEEQAKTAPIKLPSTAAAPAVTAADQPPPTEPSSPPSPPVAEVPDEVPAAVVHEPPWSPPPRPTTTDAVDSVSAEPAVAAPGPIGKIGTDVLYVPMAVSIGDGFKFGCGFFLALVLAMLVGFVLLAALFVLTSLFGLNLPISR